MRTMIMMARAIRLGGWVILLLDLVVPLLLPRPLRLRFGPVVGAVQALDPHVLECRFRQLALQYAHHLHPWRISDRDDLFRHILPDALQLPKYCPPEQEEEEKDAAAADVDKSTPRRSSSSSSSTASPSSSSSSSSSSAKSNSPQDPKINDEMMGSRWRGTEEEVEEEKEEFSLLLASPSRQRGLVATAAAGGGDDDDDDEQQQKKKLWWCPAGERCLYVIAAKNAAPLVADDDDNDDDDPDATVVVRAVFPSLAEALDVVRQSRKGSKKHVEHGAAAAANHYTTIVLRNGTHYLNETVVLRGADDSGLRFVNYPGEEVWISGGIPIRPPTVSWVLKSSSASTQTKKKKKKNRRIWTADLSMLLRERMPDTVVKYPSLFGETKRYIRARYPNMDPEIDQWGYNTPTKLNVSMDSAVVMEWHKPPPNGPIPHFVYYPHLKNDSAGWYNDYATGYGGVCEALWGPGHSYWCSNASKGGWAEVDTECAITGRLQIPVGFTIQLPPTTPPRHWEPGAIVHAWHSQSWAMHMFEILAEEVVAVVPAAPGNGTVQSFRFAPGGGRQGGRNWCRCDQCTYAARWCGQHHDNPTDDRLISGTWLVENSLRELDAPGEYYLDPATNLLHIYVNSTEELSSLRLAVLPELVRLVDGVTNVTITGIGFRDTAPTYMSGTWEVPSGGDWALHRGGAIFIENSSNITIRDCLFRRLDGNAIFLSKRTRYIDVIRNEFEWLGENAIALWGDTDLFDATKRNFPMYTRIVGNVMRELGIFQKQSSAIAHSKAAMTLISHNIIFNVPRAAINFNDMVGGGDVVRRNLLFNTCRESGDHGPINTWDRQPFLANIRDVSTPSYIPIRRDISRNFIIANYGSSEGVDNDDGSSWYHIHHNVFYDSDGFKMDYGGHDSIYEYNLVVGYPRKSMCIGFGSFDPGHGHTVRYNRCIVPDSTSVIVQLGQCDDRFGTKSNKSANAELVRCDKNDDSNAERIYENEYYAADPSQLRAQCSYSDEPIPFSRLEKDHGIEIGSQALEEPDYATILEKWALETLFSSFANDGTQDARF